MSIHNLGFGSFLSEGISDLYESATDKLGDIFGTDEEITYFKDGQEVDPPDEIKQLFMSEDDEAADMLAQQGYTAEMKVAKPGMDLKKLEKELGAVGAGKASSNRPLFTQGPKGGLPLSIQGGVSYRQTQNPYQVPSYLMNSAQYNEQISKLLGGLLARSIRSNPIKLLV